MPNEPTPPSASVDSIVHRLSWPEIRVRMKAGELLRWLPIYDTPGQKRAVFIGNDRLDNDSSLEVHRAEARRELLVEPEAKAYGFVDSFVGTLREVRLTLRITQFE